jgi:hypothetical protein
MYSQNVASEQKSSLEGLWVVLVSEEDRRVPMMAQAGPETYLLGFKNMTSARRFVQLSELPDQMNAEPRMVVRGNKTEFLRLAQDAGVTGVLVDYDPATQNYSAAAELY